jgi:biopolymer transport protein ExbD/biopolymer transport protein TolR
VAIGLEPSDSTEVGPEINVTPLVDVVLVLLIIFMVITPLLAKSFWVHAPKQEREEVARKEPIDTAPLVLKVGADRSISVNGAPLMLDELAPRLVRMFAARDDHVLFFDADDRVAYGYAVEVMDKAREGGAVTIATLTVPLELPVPLPHSAGAVR